MTPEVFAEWLRRRGHGVIRTRSSYWHSQGPRVYQAFPYHWIIQLPEEELREFLRAHRALALRYSTTPDAQEGLLSYHAVYHAATYELSALGPWARKNVRRGLRNCCVEPISFARLAHEGLDLQLDTLARQGRLVNLSAKSWEVLCSSAADLPGFEAWGARVGQKLAASVITFQMQDCCYMLYQQCLRRYLPMHTNNALSFGVTQAMIKRPNVRSILYGLHSLDAPSSMDEFKFRMGYRAIPVRQRVVFHPWAEPCVNHASYALVRGLRRALPGNPTVSKCEGMMRFYLEGKRPVIEQTLPGPLRDLDVASIFSAAKTAHAN